MSQPRTPQQILAYYGPMISFPPGGEILGSSRTFSMAVDMLALCVRTSLLSVWAILRPHSCDFLLGLLKFRLKDVSPWDYCSWLPFSSQDLIQTFLCKSYQRVHAK